MQEIIDGVAADPDLRADVRATSSASRSRSTRRPRSSSWSSATRGGRGGGAPFWADAALFAAAGIPTVVFGPVGEGAHADVEWVDLASAARCAETYLAVAAEFCA